MRLTLSVALLIAAGTPSGFTQGGRQYEKVAWKEVAVIGSKGVHLSRPLLLAADTGSIYVFDYGDHSLKAFAYTGGLKWTYGRSGGGPGEFANPTDLQVAPDHAIWILDPANGRTTIVEPSGATRRTVPLQVPIRRIVPLRNGGFMGFGETTSFGVICDSLGAVVRHVTGPTGLRGMDPFALEARVAPSPPDGAVLGFMWAGTWITVSPDGNATAFAGVEPLPFPDVLQWKVGNEVATRLDPLAPVGALSISAAGDTAYVLFGGRSRDAGRVIDKYDRRNGRYLKIGADSHHCEQGRSRAQPGCSAGDEPRTEGHRMAAGSSLSPGRVRLAHRHSRLRAVCAAVVAGFAPLLAGCGDRAGDTSSLPPLCEACVDTLAVSAEEAELGGVAALDADTHGRVFVVDYASGLIRVFGPDGSYLRDIGRKGSGPGEFDGLMRAMILSGDTVLAFDIVQRRLTLV